MRKHSKNFTKVTLIQIGFMVIVLGFTGLALRQFFKREFIAAGITSPLLEASLGRFETWLTVHLVLIAFFFCLLGIWSARKLFFPMGRLLIKARNLQNKSGSQELEEEDLATDDSFEEWTELETSIEDMRRDLASKAASLSLERAELATLMGAISDAILAVDLDGRPLFLNSRFAVLFGDAGLRNKSIHLWEMFRAPEVLSAFQLALKEGKSSSVNAVPIDQLVGQNDSGRRFLSLSVSPLLKNDREIYGAVGIFHDVTELKLAEQIRIEFVANVSHELRTPLTAIKGYTETLLDDQKSGKKITGEFLEIISRNSERLMNLINDLLDLSSIESTDTLHKETIDVRELTARVIDHLQKQIAAKEHKIETQFDIETIEADVKRVEQVLINLIDNAVKYTPAHGKVTISWTGAPSGTVLKVSDTGPGISLEHQPRLFERFYRVDKARSREQGGTGLGLAIVKHILQRHGGSVSVVSKPGQGTTFVCQFPL